jgi:hypothetical protein
LGEDEFPLVSACVVYPPAEREIRYWAQKLVGVAVFHWVKLQEVATISRT